MGNSIKVRVIGKQHQSACYWETKTRKQLQQSMFLIDFSVLPKFYEKMNKRPFESITLRYVEILPRPTLPLQSGKSKQKNRERFVDAVVLIPVAAWSKTLSNFENVGQTPFESAFEPRAMLDFAKLIKNIAIPAFIILLINSFFRMHFSV